VSRSIEPPAIRSTGGVGYLSYILSSALLGQRFAPVRTTNEVVEA
jgi:hypothetical protein